MLADEFLPVFDVCDSVASDVDADLAATWAALMQVDLIDVGRRRPMVAALGALREVPAIAVRLLRGEARVPAPATLRLRDLPGLPPDRGGWILLGERPFDEIAFGLVGKFWQPVIEFASVSPEAFPDFAQPGYAKTILSLSVRAAGDRRTRLAAMMRTATTDEKARRWFRRYWTLGAGSGAHVLVNGLLDVTRDIAETSHHG